MGNGEKLTGEEFEEIKMLVDKVITASNKKTVEPFIKRLDFMRRTLNIEPYKRIVFGELISYASAASGLVRDKEHWMGAVKQSLFRLKPSTTDMGDIK